MLECVNVSLENEREEDKKYFFLFAFVLGSLFVMLVLCCAPLSHEFSMLGRVVICEIIIRFSVT